MQTIEAIPLFRTTTAAPSAALAVAESAPKAEATATPAGDCIVTYFDTYAEASDYWDLIKDGLPACQCGGNCAACPGLWFDQAKGKYAVRDNLLELATESDIPNYIAESFAEFYPGWGDWES